MTVIIGIDPGSRCTGYGVIQCQGNHTAYLDSGCIRITEENSGERLLQIYQGLKKIIELQRLA